MMPRGEMEWNVPLQQWVEIYGEGEVRKIPMNENEETQIEDLSVQVNDLHRAVDRLVEAVSDLAETIDRATKVAIANA